VDNHYRPEDMMVLCPNHHVKATKGAMPEAEQRALKANPWNIRHQMAKGPLAVHQDYCAVSLAQCHGLVKGHVYE
jgi:hypothetical protein